MDATARMQNAKDNPGKAVHPDFGAGERAPESGIYEVVHGGKHRESRRGIMVRGQKFPPCQQCGDQVRYVLVESIQYIFDDEDFRQIPSA